MCLGFVAKMGTSGLYWGMLLGPVLQTACYLVIIGRIKWQDEAAAARAAAAVVVPPREGLQQQAVASGGDGRCSRDSDGKGGATGCVVAATVIQPTD